ncbi:flagellar hook-associated protein 3 [Verticiella sediminum]|uniref:Flagellar hook-associated protein 3 n=1 Tax=Verticiella sediminum TaxID=1247510 RepID=A0A556ARW1_9BURK|nr:flagellar hook-associated protein FlgL [Verticiella sediminum]TSH95672.1 flagellar hook-associated protein 3 [Verticiella sediminum]
MRVSTLLSQQIGLRTMVEQESKMLHAMQQLASGKRVLTPADDPLAAAQSVNVAQVASMNTRFAENRAVAAQNLNAQEQTLQEVTTMLQGVYTRIVEAGNGAYSDAELRSLADTLRETRESLLGLANATDGSGQYLFSGDRGDLAPYDEHGALASPAPAGSRNIQVTQTRVMSSADTAQKVFGRVSPGTQGYVASMGDQFEGSVSFGRVEFAGNGAGGSDQYRVSFALGEDLGMRVQIHDAAGSELIDQPYEPGAMLEFDGVRVTLSGTPVAGDEIVFDRLGDLSPENGFDLFNTLDDLIGALEEGKSTPELSARLGNALATANRKIQLHMDNVLTVRAAGGARMNELDALDNEGDSRTLNYASQLSKLEDVDYRAASMQLEQQRVALEAAQLAYLKVQGLSLFQRG